MSDVRANAGVPVIAQFGGTVTPSACAPIVVDSTTGRVYAWKTGDVIVPQATGTGTATGTNTGDQTNISGNAATVTTNANLTGPITSVGNTTSVASQTGTGSKFVMDTNPVLVGPTLGAASATSINFGGSTLSAYVVGTYTATMTGVTASVTGTGKYTIAGNIVVVSYPDLTGTSNSGSLTITGLPAAVAPVSQATDYGRTQDNGGAYTAGIALVAAAAQTIQFFPSPNGGSYTGSGTKSIAGSAMKYLLA